MYINILLLITFVAIYFATLISLLIFIYTQHSKNKHKDEYMHMLIHDIRAPLNVVKGTANILLHESTNLSNKDKITLLNQVQDTSDGLLLLVSDILDVSKMHSGKFKLSKASCDINKIVKSVVDTYVLMAKQNNIELSLNLNNDLPKLNVDQEKIKRVLTNLISNAIKYTPENGKVTLSTSLNNEFVNVCVCDTGIGIADDLKHKLFNQFVQGNKTLKSRETSSSGIGLNVAKNIINLHKGDIWIEDNDPKGSKFIFSIPVNLPEF